MLLILKTKFVNLFIILSSAIKKICYKIFSWLKLFVNQVTIFKLINNFLNFELLYNMLIDIIKLSGIELISEIIIFINII